MRARHMNPVLHSSRAPDSVWWALVRFVLGMAQMAASVIAVGLLCGVGVTPINLTAVVVASSLTSLSVMLFGSPSRCSARPRVKRLCVVALCVGFWGCADSVEGDTGRTYELTLPAPSDGSGWSIHRDGAGRVARWQVRIDGSWDTYVQWVRPRLLKKFESIASTNRERLQFRKSLAGDVYTLELRMPEPPRAAYVTATFTARPF